MILIHQEVAHARGGCLSGSNPVGERRTAQDSGGKCQNAYIDQESSRGGAPDHLLSLFLRCPRHVIPPNSKYVIDNHYAATNKRR